VTTRRYTKDSSDSQKLTPEQALSLHQKEMDLLVEKVKTLEENNDILRDRISVLDGFRMRLANLTEKLNLITRLSQEINTLDADKIANVCIDRIPLLLEAKYHNHPDEIHEKIIIRNNENSVMGLAIRQKRITLIKDIDNFEKSQKLRLDRAFAFKYVTKSCISAPLMAGNNVVGVLNFADKADGTSFDEMNDLPPVEQLSHMIGIALHNTQLFKEIQSQARTDGLTKLSNYRAFYEQLKKEMHRSVRYNHRLTMIMCDVDNFKHVNDTYGHPAGDAILEGIAEIIRGRIRREDIAARYGGDEFAMILPETPLAGATIVAERMREKVISYQFMFKGVPVPVRMSFGVAEMAPTMTLPDFVKAADEALYKAKESGKDRVVGQPM
jgi:diguanylate cyclase (GGDEF)-like protein